MAVKFTNNAATTLAANINSSATSISVTDGSVFPTITGSDHFYVTFDDTTNKEIVKVTARSSNTLTVVRGQDNTTARAFSSGDKAELRIVAALLEDVKTEVTSTLNVDTFTSDGTSAAFTLSQAPSSEDNLIVFIEGVYQNPADFTLSGTTLTLDAVPPNTRKVVAYHVSGAVSGNNLNHDQFTANGSTAAFTLSISPIHENNTQVFIDGVYQQKDSYSVSGTTLTLDANPANGAKVEVMTFTQTDVNTLPASFVSGLTEVTAVGADHFMIFDATDSALKKSLVSDVLESATSISTSADATAITIDSSENVTFTNNVTIPADLTVDTSTLKVDAGNNRVIIGHTSGSAGQLVVSNGANEGIEFIAGSASAVNVIQHYDRTSTQYLENRQIANNHTWYNGASEVARVHTNGNFGVGTNSPGVAMHIQDQASSDTTVLRLENKPSTAATNTVAMEFWGNEGTVNDGVYNIAKIYGHFDGANYSDTRLTLGSAAGNGSFNDEITLKYGKVGIGKSSPAHTLDVNGTVGIEDRDSLRISSMNALGQTGSGAMFILGHNAHVDNTTNNTVKAINSSWYPSFIKMYYNDGITFHTNTATQATAGDTLLSGTGANTLERLRIDDVALHTSGMMRAGGWYATYNGYSTGHSMEIGRSGSYAYTLSYDRSLGQYKGNIVSGYDIRFQTQGLQRLVVDANGTVYPYADNSYDLGTSAFRFDDIYATNTTIQSSDRNQKNTITDTDLGLDFINRLSPKSYKFNDGTRTHYGLIAQDVEDVLEDINKPTSKFAGFIKNDKFVRVGEDETNEDGTLIEEAPVEQVEGESVYGLRYTEFIAPMIKAIQELKAENEALKARVEALE